MVRIASKAPSTVNNGRPCLHCGERVANARRGLCVPCYNSGGVRALYETVATLRRGAATSGTVPPPPTTPTLFLPGTPEKVAVMEFRVAAGFRPCHPDDAAGDLG